LLSTLIISSFFLFLIAIFNPVRKILTSNLDTQINEIKSKIHEAEDLKKEAEKYANLLGYNFQSSEWYEMTYSLFDKKYLKIRKTRKSENKVNYKLIEKIKSLFE